MLIALVLAAAVTVAPGMSVETGGVDMSCGVDGAHLTLWRGVPSGGTRSISAEAKPGETIVVDVATWTAKSSPVLALSSTQYAFRTTGEANGKPQSAILDCGAKGAPPLKIRTLEFPAG